MLFALSLGPASGASYGPATVSSSLLQTDHKCVLDSCRYLQQRGFDVTYLPVEKNGLINLGQLADAIRPETSLVSSRLAMQQWKV